MILMRRGVRFYGNDIEVVTEKATEYANACVEAGLVLVEQKLSADETAVIVVVDEPIPEVTIADASRALEGINLEGVVALVEQ